LIKRIQILESDNLHLSEELEDALDELNELQTFMATFAGKLESKNAKLEQLKSLLELERAKTIEALDGVEPSSDFLKDDIAHLQQQIKDVTDKSSRLIRQYEQELAGLMTKLSAQKVDEKTQCLREQNGFRSERDGASLK